MEVGKTARPLNAAGEGGKVATVARKPLGIIHEEHPVQWSRGGVGGRDVATGFMSSDFAIYAVFHAGHGAPLPRAGTQVGGGRGTAISPPHVHLKGAVMVLKGRGVGRGDPGCGQSPYSVVWLMEPNAWRTSSDRTHASRRRLKRSHHTSWRTRRSSTEEQWGDIPNW